MPHAHKFQIILSAKLKDNEDGNPADGDGDFPIHLAAKTGNMEFIKVS